MRNNHLSLHFLRKVGQHKVQKFFWTGGVTKLSGKRKWPRRQFRTIHYRLTTLYIEDAPMHLNWTSDWLQIFWVGVSQIPLSWSCTGSSFHVHPKKTQILWSFSSAYPATEQLNLPEYIYSMAGTNSHVFFKRDNDYHHVISIGRPLEMSLKNTSYSSSPQSYLTLTQTYLYLHGHLS